MSVEIIEKKTPATGWPLAKILLAIAICLVAFNLRPVFSSLSALLPEVIRDMGLSATSASLLTTLPVLCLGLFAPLAPRLALRFGMKRVLLLVLLLVSLGTGLRGINNIFVLYFGTALAGIAIAIGNVLLPALVKRDFPGHITLITGFYAMALCAGAACAAALTLPILNLSDGSWHLALASWMIPALLAALFWGWQSPMHGQSTILAQPPAIINLWRDPLAWQVTLFMGLQSALAYCIFGWLAPILRLRGIEAATAGLIVSFSVMMQVASCLIVPSLAGIARDQRLINVLLALLATGGLLGMMFAAPAAIWFWAGVQGIGQGGLFAVAMTMIGLRSSDARIAAQLSGMAQGVGYVLAAAGPLFLGLLLQSGGSFQAPAGLFVALGVGIALSGLGAGRAKLVQGKIEIQNSNANKIPTGENA